MDMRGLSTFIADIRKASTSREGERERVEVELAKIRAKFKETKEMNGYDRKKYICKLLYMFMLGYEIDFGHMEAIRLLSGTKYSEKHIGYLACSVLLNEGHELLTLITNMVKIDLNSNKEMYQCLALTAIANVGGKEFAEAMSHDVQKVLIATETKSHVRKKAALTLLRLFRKYSDMVQPESVATPLLDLLGSPDFGVLNCSLSLLLGFLSKCDPNVFEGAATKSIRIIGRIVLNKETPTDYIYFGVPAPWVQMKALRTLQHYPPPSEPTLLSQITNALSKIISASEKLFKEQSMQAKPARGTPNRSNAMNGVLVEALSLVMHYDNDPELLGMTASVFGRFLNEKKDANLRYLGLSLMSRMSYCTTVNFLASVREHQLVIMNSLRDPDISIRRRALDMLYCMCETSNAGEIVGELLDYLPSADFNIREDLVLKIAILAEKFASDLTWYIDVILNIITQAGDYVSDDVWQRVCQIVTNSPKVQKHAAEMVFRAVVPNSASEILVRVASYILGEYGDQIAKIPECSPAQQFSGIHNKFLLVGPTTRALMLTCYLKFYNMYPSPALRDKIKKVFAENRTHLDPELQQRAQEYYVLCSRDDVLSAAIENMPEFEMKNNAVLQTMQNRTKDVTDKDVWKQKSEAREAAAKQTSIVTAATTQAAPSPKAPVQELLIMEETPAPPPRGGGMDDLFSGGTTAPPPQTAPPPPPPRSAVDDIFGPAPTQPPQTTPVQAAPVPAPTGPGALLDDIFGGGGAATGGAPSGVFNNSQALAAVEGKCRELQISARGIIYEDDRLQIGLLHEYQGANGRVTLFYGNKSNSAMEGLTASAGTVPHGIQIQIQQVANRVDARQQLQQQLSLLCAGPFEGFPHVKITFNCGGLTTNIDLAIPATPARFSEPLPGVTGKAQFFQAWHATPSVPNPPEPVVLQCQRNLEVPAIEAFLTGVLRFAVVRADENPNNLAAAGANTTTGPMGMQRANVLFNIETNPAAKAVRLTVKTPVPNVQAAYIRLMKQFFGVA
jgi:AP-2 complex subunit alpha